jgi:hypothetical protein
MDQSQGYEDIYGIGRIPIYWLRTGETVAVLTFASTVATVILYINDKADAEYIRYMHIAWLWWVIAPPVWFSVEYFYLFKKYKIRGTFEAFKYGQDVASKAWLAIAVALSAIVPKLS